MRIGIIGAGQLGQMLGFAARDLGVTCRFIDPGDGPPAAACGEVIKRPFDDDKALAELAATCDVITYEFENVPVEALHKIEGQVPIYPPPEALRYSQDRLDEKQLFDRLSIPLPGYRAIDSRKQLAEAADALGLPLVIKTRRLGYDGKGQLVLQEAGQIDDAWRAVGGTPLIAEQWFTKAAYSGRLAPPSRRRRSPQKPKPMCVACSNTSTTSACWHSSFSCAATTCWQTNSHRGSTTPVTGASKALQLASSKTIYAQS